MYKIVSASTISLDPTKNIFNFDNKNQTVAMSNNQRANKG
jgi:hypothetical protein